MLWFRLAPSDGQDSEWWELITPEGYQYALEDVTSLLEKTILPVVKSFEEDYEKAARELALKGYSSPLLVCRPVSHICFANVLLHKLSVRRCPGAAVCPEPVCPDV